jgi:hypothetical protein
MSRIFILNYRLKDFVGVPAQRYGRKCKCKERGLN